jgi:hypothetical protein
VGGAVSAARDGQPERAAEVERLRGLFRFFGATRGTGRSAVYEALSEATAADDGLLALLLDTPQDQRRPSLLFAAVNLLLATRQDSELAAYYPIHGGHRPVDDHLVPAFSAFCRSHRDELARLLARRSTQTNEIRRCVALRLGAEHVQRHWPGPVALVEVGASAGLNLLFDHYGYHLGDEAAPTTSTCPVVVSCEVRGSVGADLLRTTPTLTRRLGIDRHPVDLADPDARAWLEAFVWPEQTGELATLRGAVDLARSTAAARVVPGDATTDTARTLGELPGREPVVVFTASLLSYLTAPARTAFVAQLREAARRRPVAWVFAEAPGLLATTALDIPALRGPSPGATPCTWSERACSAPTGTRTRPSPWPTPTCAGSPRPATARTTSSGSRRADRKAPGGMPGGGADRCCSRREERNRMLQWENGPNWATALRRWGEEGMFLGNFRARRVPVVDRSYGDPRLAAMRAAATGGTAQEWAELRAVLSGARGPEDLTFLVEGVRDIPGVERWTADVLADRPGDPLALLVSGARHVERAWQARGAFAGSSVPPQQQELSRQRLLTAQEQLFDVAEREPRWAAPWYFLQICGHGLELGPDAAQTRFEETCRRAPGHVAAHRQHLQQLSAKRGGSHERMFSFAREAVRTAPDGSGLGQLLALAHLEVWLAAGGDEDSPVLHDPGVIRELHASAARSVHHPTFVRERDWAVGVNAFAMAFALAGEKAASRVMFRSVGRRVTETPWQYLDARSPVVPFLAWRRRVGA